MTVCGFGRADKAQVQRMVVAVAAARPRRRRPTTPPTRSPSPSATPTPRATHALRAAARMIASLRGRVVANGGRHHRARRRRRRLPARDHRVRSPAGRRRGRRRGHAAHAPARARGHARRCSASRPRPSACCSSCCWASPASAPRRRSRSSPATRPTRSGGPSQAGDHALFTSIPGIGRRTAERVVIDLKDKVGGAGRRRGRPTPRRAGRRRPHRRPRRAGRAGHVGGRGRGGAAAAGRRRCRSRSGCGWRSPAPSRPERADERRGRPADPRRLPGAGRGGVRPLAAAAQPGRVRRPGADQGAALDLPRGGPGPRRAVRARAAGRPARTGQDLAGRHHRDRDGARRCGSCRARRSTARPTWRRS